MVGPFFWLLKLFQTKSVFDNFAKSQEKKKTAVKGTEEARLYFSCYNGIYDYTLKLLPPSALF